MNYVLALFLPPLSILLLGRIILSIVVFIIWVPAIIFSGGLTHPMFIVLAWILIYQAGLHSRPCQLDAVLCSMIKRAGRRVELMKLAQDSGHHRHFLLRTHRGRKQVFAGHRAQQQPIPLLLVDLSKHLCAGQAGR